MNSILFNTNTVYYNYAFGFLTGKSVMQEKGYMTTGLFQAFSDDQKKDLLQLGDRLDFFENSRLFQRGDKGDTLYIIRKGEVTISLTSAEGKEIIISKLSAGDAFGEVALFDEDVRTADAYVTSGTVLVSVGREDFLSFLARHPSLYKDTIQLLCSRLRWCSDLLEDFLFQDTMERLVSRLVRLSEKNGIMVDSLIEITQDDLAKMLGASREAVNRNLQLLQDRSLVVLQRKRIIIPDVAALRKLLADGKTPTPYSKVS